MPEPKLPAHMGVCHYAIPGTPCFVSDTAIVLKKSKIPLGLFLVEVLLIARSRLGGRSTGHGQRGLHEEGGWVDGGQEGIAYLLIVLAQQLIYCILT